jgi:hypothetical protein
MTDVKLLARLGEIGYRNVVKINNKWCGIYRFAYTWGLVVGADAFGYERRYCYKKEGEALENLLIWDGVGHPSGNWLKCKGVLNGESIDLINPNYDGE